MRFRVAAAVAVFWMFGAAAESWAQVRVKVRYICRPGRYKTQTNNGPWHYCFDGKHYQSNQGVPKEVLAYWENLERESAERQARWDAESEARKAKVEADRQYWNAQRRAQGLPTYEESAAKHAAGAARSQASYAATQAGRGRAGRGRAGGGVEASAKPEASPIAEETLRAIAVGTKSADVTAALGEPPGKVSTGEDSESWTYVLTNGAFAKVKMEAGAVKEVVIPQ